MASFTKFHHFVQALAHGIHNLETDQLAVALTDEANPPLTSDNVLVELTQISYDNLSSRDITTVLSEQAGGTYKLVLQDLTLTASGAVGPFRYVVLYNDDASNDELIGFYDHGSEVTLGDGDEFVIDFDGHDGVFDLV